LFLTGMVSDFSSEMMNDYLEKTKDDPQKRETLLKMSLIGVELGIILLQESKEFREAFGKIHAEFFKHPESKEVIRQAISSITH